MRLVAEDERRMCGRPTRSGGECRNPLNRFEVACRVHISEAEKDVQRARWAAYNAGWSDGWKAATEEERRRVAREARSTHRKAAWRSRDADGCQIVTTSKGYAYVWAGVDDLQLGDRIMLPGNWLFSHPFEDVVEGFGTDYEGTLSEVLSRLS